MLQFALCNENEQQLQDTASAIIDFLPPGIVEITTFSAPTQLLDRIDQDGFQPDLALLHIALSEMSSSALAEQLNRRLPDCRIVFVCTRRDESTGASAAPRLWFSIQNDCLGSLRPLLGQSVSWLLPGTAGSLLLGFKGRTLVVPAYEVLYLERENRKTRVVCEQNSYLISQSPAKLIPEVLSRHIVRCHQGYWVNLAKVRSLEKNEFVLANGTRIPISRSHREQAVQAFCTFYGRE